MEDVVVMPPSITNEADISDDESESISLDLHVSDTEDSIPEITKKDTMLESEDEILNKFADEEESLKERLVNGHSESGSENGDSGRTDREVEEDRKATIENGIETDEGNDQNPKTEKVKIDKVNGKNIEHKGEKKDVEEEGKMGVENGETNAKKDEVEDKEKYHENNGESDERGEENKENQTREVEVDRKAAKCDVQKEGGISNEENSDGTVKRKSSKISESNLGGPDKKAEKSDEENQEDEDLLQVMETSFVDEADKDDNSCSSSEKDENAKEEESEEMAKDDNQELATKEDAEAMEENKEAEEDGRDRDGNGEDGEVDEQDKEIDDQNKEGDQNDGMVGEIQSDNLEGSENDESHDDVDTHECPMDIEENNIGGVIITEHDNSAENQEEGEKGSEETPEITAVVTEETPTALVNGTMDEELVSIIDDDIIDEGKKKSTKRPRPEDEEPADDSKKMRLEISPKTKTTNSTSTLNSFKHYMKEKGLKNMSRVQLEELCLQKMCECLVDKSELADLRQKVRILEQAIDTFRKEAMTVANQTRDLKIVHEKVTAALKAAKEQRGKHLVPVKITRSVGLQAVLEHPNRRHTIHNSVVQNGRTTSSNNINSNNSNVNSVSNSVAKNNFNAVNNNNSNTVNNNTPKSPVKPQQSPAQMPPAKSPVQQRTPAQVNNKPSTQKENRAVPVQRSNSIQQSNNATSRKSTEPPKAVIDLTDEDEKTTTSSPTNRINNRVNNSYARANGQSPKTPPAVVTTSAPKLMMIPSVITTRPVMLKVNSNVVSQSNGITIPPTSQVSIVAQSVASKSPQTVRVGVTNVTSSRSPPAQKLKHPAPLPLPPPLQHQITTQRPIPPRPHLNLTKSTCGTGIVLQWKMPYQLDLYEAIVSYQLYAYQETKSPPRTDSWGKIGDVKALELPMAVTLTQFAVGNRYFFAVRAVDVHKRLGPFSEPQTILL